MAKTSQLSRLRTAFHRHRDSVALHRTNVWKAVRHLDTWGTIWGLWVVAMLWTDFGGPASVWIFGAGVVLLVDAAGRRVGTDSMSWRAAVGTVFQHYHGLWAVYIGGLAWMVCDVSGAPPWAGRIGLGAAAVVWVIGARGRGMRVVMDAIEKEHIDPPA